MFQFENDYKPTLVSHYTDILESVLRMSRMSVRVQAGKAASLLAK